MEISVRTEGDICIATIERDRIDAPAAVAFKEAMRKQATTAEGSEVILNLSNVTFIDSSGLGAIVATMKLLAPEKKLILAGLNPGVAKVLQLTRMDMVFDIFQSLPEALNAERA